jgi:phi LC3 family holin
MKQNRFYSPVVWIAVVSQILSILIIMGVINIAQQEAINQVAAAILQILTVFGVLNDPTSPDQF